MPDDEKQTPAIQPGKPKKAWHKKWTPRDFALFLMSQDMRYVLPGTSNETIMQELKGKLHCGLGKVTWLRNHREFQMTVEEMFIHQIKSKFSTEMMFWCFLRHSYEKNMESEKPTDKLFDVLGHLSGEYTPRLPKPKKGEKMTPAQVAQMIHRKEQAEKKLNGKDGIKGFDIEGGKDNA